jgi:ATP-dependent Clp protease ATP-binding subunit ClpA
LRVVDKFVKEVRGQLIEKNVSLEITDNGRQWFAAKGFDRVFGARPMARLIQQNIREPLAEELLFGKLQQGGSAKVDEINGELVVSFDESSPMETPAAPDAVSLQPVAR